MFNIIPRCFRVDDLSEFWLKILTRKKHCKFKLQHLRKIQIWTFGSLVHRINSFYEVLKLEQIFQKNKVVTGKTPIFAIGPSCSRSSICLNTGFWQSSFEWKIFFPFFPVFWKRFSFSRKFASKLRCWKCLKLSLIVT